MRDRTRARELAAEYAQKGDPTGWFEVLYKESEEGKSIVPWADRGANPGIVEFWKAHPQATEGKNALVIASGLGDDAEQLAAWGFLTTAFDISETAIRTARKRFPQSEVNYRVSVNLRTGAILKIASFVRPRGKLLAIVRGREENEPLGELPWPLTRAEVNEFVRAGLAEEGFEEYFDNEDPPARRFRVLYTRP
jgi:hypothetical protein